MAPTWFDPLIFALSCLGGGGMLLSLVFGGVANGGTPAARCLHAVVALLAFAAGVFAVFAGVAGQSVALWGSAATLAALYVLLIVLPSSAATRAAGAAATGA